MKTDGENLRLLIRGLGLSQAEAALKMGVSRQTLNAYFNRAELSPDVLQIVKDKLGLIVNPSPSDRMEEATVKYLKQGHTPTIPILSTDQGNVLLMSINAASYAAIEMLCRVVSNQEKIPLETVRTQANQLTHERQRLVEQVLDKLVSVSSPEIKKPDNN
ncbi:helix-turn-helix domain-containing protein [Polynucleobacter sp.]|uniref:helix-turn-helix domain-containing protein n=1 Tax=Polynucleobacter sp. TaxID=2029855 RepID=UPI003F6984B8